MRHLVVGLGNPEKKYASTRHNVGAMVIDALARELSAPPFKLDKRFHALIAECQTAPSAFSLQPSASIILAKPQTFMNLSGQSVAALCSKYRNFKISKSLLIVSDDLDLPFGAIRFRERGSAGGHNGLKSVIESLGTNEFPRLKIGIRPEGLARQPGKAEDFVLERFSADELMHLKNDIIPKAVHLIIEKLEPGISESGNRARRTTIPKF